MGFLGFFALDGTGNDQLLIPVRTRNGSGVLADASSSPGYRIYQASATNALMSGGTGSLSLADSGSVTNATDSGGLIRITSSGHGLQTGDRVVISGVGGVTAANSTWTITRIDANTFDLQGSTHSGSYTSGGEWHVAGLYKAQHSLASASGYERGRTYFITTTYTVSGSVYSQEHTFTVV